MAQHAESGGHQPPLPLPTAGTSSPSGPRMAPMVKLEILWLLLLLVPRQPGTSWHLPQPPTPIHAHAGIKSPLHPGAPTHLYTLIHAIGHTQTHRHTQSRKIPHAHIFMHTCARVGTGSCSNSPHTNPTTHTHSHTPVSLSTTDNWPNTCFLWC